MSATREGSMTSRMKCDEVNIVWASWQIRTIAGCACVGNARNFFPATDWKLLVSDPNKHHDACVKHVPWFILAGKTFRHSRCMRNPQFYVSGRRSVLPIIFYNFGAEGETEIPKGTGSVPWQLHPESVLRNYENANIYCLRLKNDIPNLSNWRNNDSDRCLQFRYVGGSSLILSLNSSWPGFEYMRHADNCVPYCAIIRIFMA